MECGRKNIQAGLQKENEDVWSTGRERGAVSCLISCELKKSFKVKVKIFGFFKFFLKTASFTENFAQTKIVDHKIIYNNVPHTFFPKNHHS